MHKFMSEYSPTFASEIEDESRLARKQVRGC